MNPVVSSYAFGLFFGSLLPVRVSSILLEMSLQDILLNFVIRLLSLQDWTDMDEGWLYGEWETGPWWAFHTKVKDGSRELICHNVTYYVLQICVFSFFPFSNWHVMQWRRRMWGLTVGLGWALACADPRFFSHNEFLCEIKLFPFSWRGGTRALLQTSLKEAPSCLRMARNFSTRLGSRTCKRPTRRTRRQSTWSPLGEKLHREWMTYYCWRCVHKTGTTPMMSTHGKVTDFQMWDEVLPDEQLLKVLEKNSELFQLSLF